VILRDRSRSANASQRSGRTVRISIDFDHTYLNIFVTTVCNCNFASLTCFSFELDYSNVDAHCVGVEFTAYASKMSCQPNDKLKCLAIDSYLKTNSI
jgi:hypothetical protein